MKMNIMQFLNFFPFLPPLFNTLYSIMSIFCGIMLVYYVMKWIKKIGAIRTLLLFKDGSHKITRFKVKDGELQIRPKKRTSKRKPWTPRVDPDCIIPPKKNLKSMIKFWGFKQRDMVIAVEDSPKCISIKGIDAVAIGDTGEGLIRSVLLETWTLEEIQRFLKKALAEGAVSRKLFSDTQFYMFMGILLFIFFLQFMIAQRMGII
jgi:hypothetical protein